MLTKTQKKGKIARKNFVNDPKVEISQFFYQIRYRPCISAYTKLVSQSAVFRGKMFEFFPNEKCKHSLKFKTSKIKKLQA